jgi:ATP/maltotriose-dependent transcriptional regulator MalT/DNA-binding SARP family transcriptional activator
LSRLPPHHIPRPRLTGQCLDASVVVAEAAAGYGKTVLAAELVDAWRSVGVEVALHDGGVPARLFAARLRTAVKLAGFPGAAAAMAEAGDDPAGAVDLLLGALAEESCTFVIDDAHHADRGSGALIERIAARLRPDQHLVVLARHLPDGTQRLRRADCLQLTAADLALRPDETLRLCRSGFGLEVGPADVAALELVTAGWTAAAALAAARARRTGEDVASLARVAAGTDRRSGAVAAILDEALTALPPDQRPLLAQVARLPLLDPIVVDVAAGADGYFDAALEAGLPFTPGRDGWWDLPGPVRDHLASLGGPDSDALRRAAAAYSERGQLGAALQMLLACGDPDAAAQLLAGTPPGQLETLDVLEIQAVVDRLPAEAIEAHPDLLAHYARIADAAGLFEIKTTVLDRLSAIMAGHPDSPLARSVEVERATDLIREGADDQAEQAARGVLAASGPGELLTRARAYSALARLSCRYQDAAGRRDLAALRDAEGYFGQAAQLYERLGMRGARAGLVPYQAVWIDYAQGNAHSALERLEAGLASVVDQPRRWAYLLIYHAEVCLELARFERVEADVRDVLRVGTELRDEVLLAYGHWDLAISASHRRDAEETLEQYRQAETHKGDWWGAAAADFLADAADNLDRVGYSALAVDYLRRAQQNPLDGEPVIAVAEGALLARHGDPVLAEERLLAAPGHRVDPREYWRLTLLRAYAAFRRGDAGAGALAARAFEEAARLGLPQLPLTKEGEISEELLGLAAETGQPAALALEAASLPVSLSVLGPFGLTRGGRPVPLTAGQGTQLLKLAAVSGGQIPADVAIEALWPDAGREAGRNRLRTVLNRQRAEAGEVIIRAGDLLRLAPEIRVDLAQFEAEGRRALALWPAEPALAVAVARAAIARYRGDLLAGDPYEEWAELPREHARRTMLRLLDLCADAAAQRGDLDETRRILELTIDLAPYDDERYLRTASTLLEQDRRGAALTVVRRARTVLAELGLQPPHRLLTLEQAIVA